LFVNRSEVGHGASIIRNAEGEVRMKKSKP